MHLKNSCEFRKATGEFRKVTREFRKATHQFRKATRDSRELYKMCRATFNWAITSVKLEMSGSVVIYVAKHSLYYLLLTTYVATTQLLSIFDGNHYVMGMLYGCWRQNKLSWVSTYPTVCMWLCMYVLQNVHRYGTTGYVHVIITDSDNSNSFINLNCITNTYVTLIAIMVTSFTVLYPANAETIIIFLECLTKCQA